MTNRRFTAIADFYSAELQSAYVAGLAYEAREQDHVLLGLLDQWIAEGKIREGGAAAVMTALAEVT